MNRDAVLLTGATGHLGRAALARMLAGDPKLRAYVIVRNPARWAVTARTLGDAANRVIPLQADLTTPGFGLPPLTRGWLSSRIGAIVHLAGNTSLAQTLTEGRHAHVDSTRHLLELADARTPIRFVLVSTAFVAGDRTGRVAEQEPGEAHGFLNAHEQSKHEAEELVREQARDWLILRPAAVVCDDASGRVTQINAVHRALRVYHRGLAALMPGTEDTPVDVVTTDYVADAIARLVLRHHDLPSQTLHLCAGTDAPPLGELLDRAYEGWARSPEWRRRGIARPALSDLPSYRRFEDSVAATGDARLQRVVRSLSHFVPQLAYPKVFETRNADAVLQTRPPAMREVWSRLIDQLMTVHWGRDRHSLQAIDRVA